MVVCFGIIAAFILVAMCACLRVSGEEDDKIEGQMVPRGDLIRAMDDEDLAWVLMEFRFDAICKAHGGEPALPDSQSKTVEWLRQEKQKE